MKTPQYLTFVLLLLTSFALAQPSSIDFIRSDHNAGPQRYGDGVIAQLVAGDMRLQQGRWEEAILAYDNAVAQWPYWAPVYVKRASAKMRMGRMQEAEQDLDYARRLSINSVALFSDRAPAGRQALLAGPEAWLLESDSEDGMLHAQLNEITSYKASGRLGEADRLIRHLAAREQMNWTDIALLQGNLYLLRSDYLRAIDYYSSALGELEHGALYHNRGLARILSYNFRDGCSDLLRAIELGYQPGEDQWSDLCTF